MRSTLGGVVILCLLGALVAAPVSLHYATSGSMEPEINENEIYVVWHGSDIAVGDIALYDSLERNEPVTHRVVGEAESGFITKGDANQQTDQATGSPTVPAERIRGTVIEYNGHAVTAPGGETLVLINTYQLELVLVSLLLIIGEVLRTSTSGRIRPEDVSTKLIPAIVVIIGIAVVVVYSGGASQAVTVVATNGDAVGNPGLVPIGESTDVTARFTGNPQTVFTHEVTTVSGEMALKSSQTVSTVERTVVLNVPSQQSPGTVDAVVSFHRYPLVLPPTVIDSLVYIHPFVAAVVTTSMTFLPVLFVVYLFIDPKTLVRGDYTAQTQTKYTSKDVDMYE